MSRCLVTGGAGYIGSHLVDYLIEKGHEVSVIDNFCSMGGIGTELSGVKNLKNVVDNVKVFNIDIVDLEDVTFCMWTVKPDIIFHLAAVSRTPWAVNRPIETYETNVVGSANVLEAARQTGVKKVVLASSNIVYAAQTPYKTSKLAMEQVARDYNDLYDLPTVCLRFSNVAGGDVSRQHDDNVLKSLAKSKRENGYITITGDGEQTRNFTNVNDVCRALHRAAGFVCDHEWSFKGLEGEAKECLKCGDIRIVCFDDSGEEMDQEEPSGFDYLQVRGTEIDIMHPKTWSLNEIAPYFKCPVKYVKGRKGDIKHLEMGIGPSKAEALLGFKAEIGLEDYISSYTEL